MRAVIGLIIVAAIAVAGWYFFLRDGGDLVGQATALQESACACETQACALESTAELNRIAVTMRDALDALPEEARAAYSTASDAAFECMNALPEEES